MSDNNTTTNSGGIGVFGLLGVMFVGLKLTGYISWPWVWVLAPFWIPLTIALIIIFIVACIYAYAEQQKNARR